MLPLLLLWKGIARMVARQPEIPVLFGAVSISNDYNQASREMIYRFFEARMQQDELAELIQPRRPFRPGLLREGGTAAECFMPCVTSKSFLNPSTTLSQTARACLFCCANMPKLAENSWASMWIDGFPRFLMDW